MPRCNNARLETTPDTLPAPSPAMLCLLRLLRRPMPLGELRPAATAAGMAAGEVDDALAVATRRRAIGLAMIAGTACVVRRPGA
jgi:hypothetical protein